METIQIIFAASAVVGVFLVFSPLWRWVRFFETIIHEFGHAAVGVLLGQKLTGFKIRYDTSGETNTLTYGYGLRGLLTHLAGYPTPILLGVLTIYYSVFYGASVVFIWVYTAISFTVLLFVRNWFGLVPVAVMSALLISSFILNKPEYNSIIILTLAVTLVLGGIRSIISLWRKPEGSDAELIVQYLGGFRSFWVFIITIISASLPAIYIWAINSIMSYLNVK